METITILVIGDVVGSPGRDTLKRCLASARAQHSVDAVIANGENAAGGFGLTAQTAQEMFDSGVDFITSGNHIWDKREIKTYLESSERVIRPANYAPGSPGKGSGTLTIGPVTIGIVNVMGRVFMTTVDDPFRVAKEHIDELRAITNVIIMDVHAEATSEKVALGRYFDGQVSFVYGTHTHVQTADEHILDGGTAYLTDVGMTGPSDGVIGMATKAVLDRFLGPIGERFSVEEKGPRQFCAAVVTIDTETGKARDIKRIFLRGIA